MITTIEKNVFEGEGLARFEGQTVFIKGVIEGEVVEFSIIKKYKNYTKAKLEKIITKSPHRITPKCPLSNCCGGCDFGFIDYDYQAKIKENIIKEIFQNFENVNFLPFIKSPLVYNYRAKTQYPATDTKNSKRVILGYYKEKTHDIINIKYCPIQPEIVDKIIEFIRNNWIFGCYHEKEHKGLLRHVNIRISTTNNDILLTLVLNSKTKPDIKNFTSRIISEFPQIKGVFVNLNPDKTNKITGDKTYLIQGVDYIIQNLGKFRYKLGGNSFFQVNPHCAELLFENAKKLIKNKGNLLDLYGGSGVIGIFMSDSVDKICLVEENEESIALAKENYKLNNIDNFEIINSKAKECIQKFEKEKIMFENIIIDPPRKGADEETLSGISKLTKNIIYISCNPMTLRRDSLFLIQKGFKLKSVQGADMFPNTHHIECIAHFEAGENA